MTSSGPPRWEERRRARAAALQQLYQCEVGGLSLTQAAHVAAELDEAEAPVLDGAARAFAMTLAGEAWADRAAIDERIGAATRNWRVERLAVLDRLVLRLAVAELLHHPETPPRVVLDEAIEIARAFSGDEAARFVNGVLDGVFRRLRDEGQIGE
ncbi:MAG: transcription antitermination factor NusB [Vicinamibacterales bacterium]